MRHNNKINHLGRTHSHRDALLSNMAVSLLKHKRIFTTLAKAKELRKYVEPLITKSKEDTTHSRRVVFQNLRDKYAVTELFQEISQKIGDRPGGYTRIIKTGNRLGDNASMCFIELVDYNELMLKDKKAPAKAKTRRSRGKSGAATTTTAVTTPAAAKTDAPKAKAPAKKAAAVEPVVEELPAVEETVKTEVAEIERVIEAQETPIKEIPVEEAQETPTAEIPAEETPETPAEETK